MTLAAELAGAFVAGIGFTIVVLAVSAKPLSRWAMRRMMKKAIVATGRTSDGEPVSIHRVDG